MRSVDGLAEVSCTASGAVGESHAPAHLPALDGLRGVAILLVLAVHLLQVDGPVTIAGRVFRNVFSAGWVGVDLFFVLSGFLITGILVSTLGRPHYFRRFYVRRTLRIFPLYYATLAMMFFILPFFIHLKPEASTELRRTEPWFWLYATNLLCLVSPHNNSLPTGTGHFWSLAVEEQFYLVWPLFIWMTGERRALQGCVALFAGAAVFRATLLAGDVGPYVIYTVTPARVDALAAGAAVAILMRSSKGVERLMKIRRVLFPAALILLVVTVAMAGLQLGYLVPAVQLVGYSSLAIFFASVLFGVIRPVSRFEHLVGRTLKRPTLRFFGKFSYAMYVFHYPVRELLRFVGVHSDAPPTWLPVDWMWTLLVAALATMITVILALISWYAFERHFLRLKDILDPSRVMKVPFV